MGEGEPLPGLLADLAASPQDGDALAAVRLAVRKALAADPVLEAEVRSMFVGAHVIPQGFDQVIPQVLAVFLV